MQAIHYVFDSTDHNEVDATGISALGQRGEQFVIGNCIFGVLLSNQHYSGIVGMVSRLHDKLLVLPKPSKKVKREHINCLQEINPVVKEGDLFEETLALLYKKVGSESFNPDNY